MNPVAVYDFTLSKEDHEPEAVKACLKEYAKKWVFQLEKGDSGYEHYQGRISLIKKRRLTELAKLLKGTELEGCHLSVTHDKDEDSYCMKADTRLDGPWSNTDEVKIKCWDMADIIDLRPWQKSLIDIAGRLDKRHINVILDKKGNIGKTTLCKYMGINKIARIIPFVNDYKELMQIVMDCPVAMNYVIDMPRAINKDKLNQLYSGIETMKGGYAYDTRYHFKDRWFGNPNVFVFTNIMPPNDLLSGDRWVLWEINDAQELIQFEV